MGAQRGKDILLKLDETGGGTFETIAGLRASRIGFNADTVDVTTTESAGHWRELLAGAGVKSASITGSGVFKDQAEMTEIASIPPLPVLRGMFVNVINSPIQGLVLGLNAIAEKKSA